MMTHLPVFFTEATILSMSNGIRVRRSKISASTCAWATAVCATCTMVHVAQTAVAQAQVDAEILDLRTLIPLDIERIVASVKKTGRCVIIHEATRTCGYGAELSALVQEHCFHHLEAPIQRVTGWDTPYPHSLEWSYFPGPSRVAEALRRTMQA